MLFEDIFEIKLDWCVFLQQNQERKSNGVDLTINRDLSKKRDVRDPPKESKSPTIIKKSKNNLNAASKYIEPQTEYNDSLSKHDFGSKNVHVTHALFIKTWFNSNNFRFSE